MPRAVRLTSARSPLQTDPENTDYTMEHGATRNFQAEKLLEEEEKRVQKEREDEELNNPMKVRPVPLPASARPGGGAGRCGRQSPEVVPGAHPWPHPRAAPRVRMQESHTCDQVVTLGHGQPREREAVQRAGPLT